MSEPNAVADRIEQIAPGVWHWHVLDERISFRSDAHAVAANSDVVLIDPLPVYAGALQELGRISAICLTAACHQRSAWRLRREYGVRVCAPEGCREMEEEPDVWYRAGMVLPGDLRVVHTPGPEPAHHAFLREGDPAVLFCADLIMTTDDGVLEFVPGQYHDDPDATRESVEQLLELPFSILCLDHGAPITTNPKDALRELLERTHVT